MRWLTSELMIDRAIGFNREKDVGRYEFFDAIINRNKLTTLGRRGQPDNKVLRR